jgi:hypothetical protein
MNKNLTIFTCPKPFQGIIKTIQDNAIQSWLHLKPTPEIILFGNEPGTAEYAQKYQLVHLPKIKVNQNQTPYVNDLYHQAQTIATHPILCYLNADIILDPLLPEVVFAIMQPNRLLLTPRWNLDVFQQIDFSLPNWWNILLQDLNQNGTLHGPTGIDLFIFYKGSFKNLPPFAIGWPGAVYDNWLIWHALHQKTQVIDISPAIKIIHQNHPQHHPVLSPEKMQERPANLALARGYGHCYDLRDIKYELDIHLNIIKKPFSLTQTLRQLKLACYRLIKK